MGHMALMEDMEDTFDISIDTPDVLSFSSYEKVWIFYENMGLIFSMVHPIIPFTITDPLTQSNCYIFLKGLMVLYWILIVLK